MTSLLLWAVTKALWASAAVTFLLGAYTQAMPHFY